MQQRDEIRPPVPFPPSKIGHVPPPGRTPFEVIRKLGAAQRLDLTTLSDARFQVSSELKSNRIGIESLDANIGNLQQLHTEKYNEVAGLISLSMDIPRVGGQTNRGGSIISRFWSFKNR